MKMVIGLDIGTTNTKAVAFTLEGKPIAEQSAEYPILTPKPGWAEQDCHTIFSAVVEVLGSLTRSLSNPQIIAVGVSSAMHSLIAVDREGRPLTHSIIWADNRSSEQAERLRKKEGKEIYLRTGTPIHPMTPFCKLLWFQENDPDLTNRAHKWISIKDYMIYRFFGEYVTDYSVASATGLFNLERMDYDEKALNLIGIPKEKLPRLVSTTHVFQGMDPHWSELTGIPQDTPFVIGASDGCLANLGIGALEPGEVAVTIGTSAAIRTMVDKPLTDPKQRTFCYALADNKWVVGGPSNNGAILLKWLKEQIAADIPLGVLLEEAAGTKAGSEGLLCLPYLAGERAPIWNANARGVFFGMALHHKRAHLVRAAMEGVLFAVYSIGKALRELAGEFKSLRASGGFARSSLWCQMMADIFGTKVFVPENHQSSCFGAAILALYSIGQIDRLDYFRGNFSLGKTYEPDVQNHGIYQRLYSVYEEVYAALIPSFAQIARIQGEG